MIDAYASRAHFHRHLAPVMAALPPGLRGTVWKPYSRATWPGFPALDKTLVGSPVIVAGSADAHRFRSRRAIYVEHGAGQSYLPGRKGLSMSYSGSHGYDHVGVFLCPNEAVAGRWRARYPEATVAVVGMPALDCFQDSGFRNPDIGTVAVTWHWECNLLPETRSAFPRYAKALPELRRLVESHGRRLIGHAHPKARGMEGVYRRAGIEWVPALEEVYERADVLLVDNSSVGYEFAALGRQTLWMNAPWYRRDVHHGLRFWDQVPGPQVDHPDDLLSRVDDLLAGRNVAWWDEERRRGMAVARGVVGPVDGRASMRAADVIATYAATHG